MPIGSREILITFRVGFDFQAFFCDVIELCTLFLHVFMRNVSLQVQKSPVYRREGINIHSDVFISVAQAILGGIAKAQGLYEPISMVVSSSFPTRTLMSG